jgi:hypothetical protein
MDTRLRQPAKRRPIKVINKMERTRRSRSKKKIFGIQKTLRMIIS